MHSSYSVRQRASMLDQERYVMRYIANSLLTSFKPHHSPNNTISTLIQPYAIKYQLIALINVQLYIYTFISFTILYKIHTNLSSM